MDSNGQQWTAMDSNRHSTDTQHYFIFPHNRGPTCSYSAYGAKVVYTSKRVYSHCSRMSLTPILAPHTVYAPPSQLLKFAVLGDGFVGKSAITLRFVRNCKVRKHEQCCVCRVLWWCMWWWCVCCMVACDPGDPCESSAAPFHSPWQPPCSMN